MTLHPDPVDPALAMSADLGELSRCLQHETDHLSGVLFLDRLTGQRRKDALRQLRQQ